MGTPNAILQVAANAIAAEGNYISLHTAAAGTTGANETSGGSYARQPTDWTPDGLGNVLGSQVNIPAVAGTYVESGIYSTPTGNFLTIPAGFTATGSNTGGDLPSGTVYYVCTATNFAGETVASIEQAVNLTGSTSSVALQCSAVTGATGYNWYRGSSSAGENVRVASTTAPGVVDTGAAGASATPPTANTASTFVSSNAFTTGPITVQGSTPSVNVNPQISL